MGCRYTAIKRTYREGDFPICRVKCFGEVIYNLGGMDLQLTYPTVSPLSDFQFQPLFLVLIRQFQSMTPLGDSPVDVVDRGIIKQEEELDDGSPIAP